jgi:hypothetical protein
MIRTTLALFLALSLAGVLAGCEAEEGTPGLVFIQNGPASVTAVGPVSIDGQSNPDAGTEPEPDALQPDTEDTGVEDAGTEPDTTVECPDPTTKLIAKSQVPSDPVVGDYVALSVGGNGGDFIGWDVDAPAGSMTSLTSSADTSNPVFLFDVPGQYLFTAVAKDECGIQTSEVSVDVGTNLGDGIEVVMVWTGQAGYTDHGKLAAHGAADLDMHFMHPDAPYNPEEAPDKDGDGEPDPYFDQWLDCTMTSPGPNWGPLTNKGEDPMLSAQNSGPGPELLTLPNPQEGLYRLAVHYEGHHGPMDPTAVVVIMVLFDGQVQSVNTEELVEGDLWCVGLVNGDDGSVTPCPNLPNGPITANY